MIRQQRKYLRKSGAVPKYTLFSSCYFLVSFSEDEMQSSRKMETEPPASPDDGSRNVDDDSDVSSSVCFAWLIRAPAFSWCDLQNVKQGFVLDLLQASTENHW